MVTKAYYESNLAHFWKYSLMFVIVNDNDNDDNIFKNHKDMNKYQQISWWLSTCGVFCV